MTQPPQKSDRDAAADRQALSDDFASLRHLLDDSDIGEVFDAAARQRIGNFISAARTQSAQRRRCARDGRNSARSALLEIDRRRLQRLDESLTWKP